MAVSSLFGLIGYPLGHSFSKRYFTEKFADLGLSDSHAYTQFEIPTIQDFPFLRDDHPTVKGFNVTIPYKQQIMPFLDEIDPAALRIGAVNTIKVMPTGKLKGFNTDYFGFKNSLEAWSAFDEIKGKKVVVLGQGGAAKAVIAALEDLQIPVVKVSRVASEGIIAYADLPEMMEQISLFVNTTPLGMHPNIHTFPPIPYEKLSSQHYLYDLVYNPLQTTFLQKGISQGVGGTHAGLAMLHGQADKAWEIWQA